ncbi:MAG: hypothetical protein ACK4Z5_11895, partial [Brevundimonas sp.]
MTAAPTPEPTTPQPKAPPPLDLRAPRPRAVRIRAPIIRAVVIGAGALVAGALTWAFVIQPEMRAAAFERRAEATEASASGDARPSDLIRERPARYDGLAAEGVLELDVVDGDLRRRVQVAVLSGRELDPRRA